MLFDTGQKIEKTVASGKAFLCVVTSLLFITAAPCRSAFERRAAGARAAALGSAATAFRWNLWSVNCNPAFAGLCGRGGAVSAQPSLFGMSELAGVAAVWNEGIGPAGLSLLLETSGYELYREFQTGAAFSAALADDVRFGLAFRFHHAAAKRYGGDGCFSLDAGASWNADDDITVAASAINVTQSRLGSSYIEKTPLLLALGASIQLQEDVLFCLDVIKDVAFPANVRAGIEVRPLPMIAFRAGATSDPATWNVGAGVGWAGVEFDYAATAHPDLGWSQTLSLSLKLADDADQS